MIRQLRVLHVADSLDACPTGQWLHTLLDFVPSTRINFAFALHGQPSPSCAESLRRHDVPWYQVKAGVDPFTYIDSLRRVIQDTGPYDVIQSHVEHLSGLVLFAASVEGVRVRIAHSHHTRSRLKSAHVVRRITRAVNEKATEHVATHYVAASRLAGDHAFPRDWIDRPGSLVHLSGVDLRMLSDGLKEGESASDAAGWRTAVLMPADPRRSAESLNGFVRELAHHLPITSLHVVVQSDHVPALGALPDEWTPQAVRSGSPEIDKLLCGCVDVVVIPDCGGSIPELAIKAQAAGLVCVLPANAPDETVVIPSLVRYLPQGGVSNWDVHSSNALLGKIEPRQALSIVTKSPYNIKWSALGLEGIYNNVA